MCFQDGIYEATDVFFCNHREYSKSTVVIRVYQNEGTHLPLVVVT